MRLIIGILCLLIVCDFAAGEKLSEVFEIERPEFKITIRMENSPNDGSPPIESYIKREFRELKDVSIVDYKVADYFLSIGVIPVKDSSGNVVVNVIQYTMHSRPDVFSSLYADYHDRLSEIPTGMFRKVDDAVRDSGAWAISFVGHAYGNNESLSQYCKEIVAKIDTDAFEIERNKAQRMIDTGNAKFRD